MLSKKRQEGIHGTPDFIDILSYDDRISYEKLQKDVGSSEYRYNRNHRYSTLSNILEKIKLYCQEKEDDKWKRYLVCGICWFDIYMAINTKQLRLLISKSKSSINDALSKMGYKPISMKGEPSSLLFETIPFLYGNQPEFRKWSIRKKDTAYLNQTNDTFSDINYISTDEEVKYKEELAFLDELVKNLDSVKSEKEDDGFKFINFTENVDFDIEFGYDYGTFSSNEEKNEIIDFEYLNRTYEEGTTYFY